MAERGVAAEVPSQIRHYRVLRVAGQWAQGWLLHGCDTTCDRNVLLKTLSPRGADQPEVLARFINEGRITACLNHPNVISVLEFDANEDPPFMALEALGGETLAKALQRGISLRTGLPVLRQVLAGLACMHALGVIHRDVNPGAVVARADGSAKIADLWLAKKTDMARRPSGTALRLATLSYLAPERAVGEDGDGRGDLFSVGCLLYEMVTGQKPFQGQSITEVLSKIAGQEPDMGQIPSGGRWDRLRDVVRRALRKRPEDRYPDARVMRSDLGLALEELGSDAEWTRRSSGDKGGEIR